MGILKTIFGGGEVISEGFKLLDNLHTSDVEEIREKNAAKVNLLKAYSAFKVAQRVLAFGFTAVYLSCFLVSLGAILHAHFTGALAVVTSSAGQSVLDLPLIVAIRELMAAYKMDWIQGTIILFYFGGGMVEGIQEKVTERKARQSRQHVETPR